MDRFLGQTFGAIMLIAVLSLLIDGLIIGRSMDSWIQGTITSVLMAFIVASAIYLINTRRMDGVLAYAVASVLILGVWMPLRARAMRRKAQREQETDAEVFE